MAIKLGHKPNKPGRKPGRPKGTGQGLKRGNVLLTKNTWGIVRREARQDGVSEAAKLRELIQAGMVALGLVQPIIGNPPAHPSPLENPVLLAAELPTVKLLKKQEPDA